MDEILNQLIKERDEIRSTFEPMRERLARLDAAISALQGQSYQPATEDGRKRRKNVRATVVDIVSRSGDNGVTVSDILEEAPQLEKTSVSTLLSNLKRAGSVIVHEGKYMIAPEGTQPEAPSGRGRRRKQEA